MKKLNLLSIISGTALLSACATPPNTSAPALANEKSEVNAHAMMGASELFDSTEATETTHDTTLPTSTVKLSAKDGRLTAKLYTDWNGAKQGTLRLHWIAPGESHCMSTTFPIMKYKEASDYSWAYRTLQHESADGSIACPGVWKAEVLYTPTKVVVGKAELNVSAESTLTPTKAATK